MPRDDLQHSSPSGKGPCLPPDTPAQCRHLRCVGTTQLPCGPGDRRKVCGSERARGSAGGSSQALVVPSGLWFPQDTARLLLTLQRLCGKKQEQSPCAVSLPQSCQEPNPLSLSKEVQRSCLLGHDSQASAAPGLSQLPQVSEWGEMLLMKCFHHPLVKQGSPLLSPQNRRNPRQMTSPFSGSTAAAGAQLGP